MKATLIFITIWCSTALQAQPENAHWFGQQLDIGKTYHTFANNLTLRDAPSKDGATIVLLPINTAVTVLKLFENTVQIMGFHSPWAQVQIGERQGYVAAAMLASGRHALNDGSHLLYTRTGSGNEDHYQDKLLFRHVTASGFKEFPPRELFNNSFAVQVSDNRGLQGIDHVIEVRYLAESCGEQGGKSYYTLDLNKSTLTNLGIYSSIGDGGVYHQYEELTFPADEDGRENVLIYTGEQGSYIDDAETEYRTIKKSRNYEWSNGGLVKAIVPFVYE